MNNIITEKFIELSAPYYSRMLDVLEKYFDARNDAVSTKQETNELEKEAYERNADLQAVFQALDEICCERDIKAFDVLDNDKIQKKFIGGYFYFMDDISSHVKP
jgi:hypothetical protein